jgi:hypothetical protein
MKGFLYKGEFMVAIHLIGLAKKGVQLPVELPEGLINIARGDQV